MFETLNSIEVTGTRGKWGARLARTCNALYLVVLVGWLGLYAGLKGTTAFSLTPSAGVSGSPVNSTEGLFAFHPLFMSLAFLALSTEQILALSKRSTPAKQMKVQEVKAFLSGIQLLQAALLLLAVVSVTAAKNLKRPEPYQHFYSVHSWGGLLLASFFLLHWITSILTYLLPLEGGRLGGLQKALRLQVTPYHRFSSLLIHKLALAVIVGGLQNYQGLIMQRKALARERLAVHSDPSIVLPQILAVLVCFSGLGTFYSVFPSTEEHQELEKSRRKMEEKVKTGELQEGLLQAQ